MKKARMIIDILMTLLLPLLMAYSLIGENVHEVLGICIFVLFIAHHVINRKWWMGLFTSKRARLSIRFLLDYTAIMVLVAQIAFWVQNVLLKISTTRT